MPNAMIDHCHLLMQQLGWCVGESASRTPEGETLWQVAAMRDGHRILVWAPTQPAAWQAAYRLADRAKNGAGRILKARARS